MRMMRWITIALLAGTLAVRAADTGTDPAHKYAWGENIGWVNFEQTLTDAEPAAAMFYRVNVEVTP